MFSHQDINFEYFKRKNNLETFKSIAKEILLLEDINIKFEVTENERIIKNNSKVPKKNGKDPLIEETIKIFDGKLLKSKAINKE